MQKAGLPSADPLRTLLSNMVYAMSGGMPTITMAMSDTSTFLPADPEDLIR
jgi:hypothetical protein